MPQVDLESLVSVCSGGASTDRKIACETLADATAVDDDVPPETAPDLPPESFYLSKDAEQEWFDRNAFIERKGSGKGNSHSTNLNPNPNPESQRFSFNFMSKASIIGLPKKFVDTNNRKKCKPAINTRLFPKRIGSSLKSDSSMVEPSSPKVSCMGRVRSKKDRKRRAKNSQQPSENTGEKRKTGFLASFRAIFRTGCRDQTSALTAGDRKGSTPRKSKAEKKSDNNAHDILARLPAGEADAPRRSVAEGEAPGLGGMKRFASGRKSDSWLDADVARS